MCKIVRLKKDTQIAELISRAITTEGDNRNCIDF